MGPRLTCRRALLLILCAARSLFTITEQPNSSIMEYVPYITFIVRGFKKLGLFWGQTFLLPGFIWFQNSLIKLDCLIQFLLAQCWIEVDGGTRSKNMEAYKVMGISVLALVCHHVLIFKKKHQHNVCFLCMLGSRIFWG